MDLSKLPRLSQTDPPPPAAEPGAPVEAPTPSAPMAGRAAFCWRCASEIPGGQRFCGKCGAPSAAPPSGGAGGPGMVAVEIWFYAIIGIALMLWGGTFARYEVARLLNKPYHTAIFWGPGDEHVEGSEIPYTELYGHPIWNDSAIFSFGLALAIGAAARLLAFRPSRLAQGLLAAALLLSVVATLYNLYIAYQWFKLGVIPIISLLLAAFGGYLVYDLRAALVASMQKSAPDGGTTVRGSGGG